MSSGRSWCVLVWTLCLLAGPSISHGKKQHDNQGGEPITQLGAIDSAPLPGSKIPLSRLSRESYSAHASFVPPQSTEPKWDGCAMPFEADKLGVIARWKFDNDLFDSVSNMHGVMFPVGTKPRFAQGGLILGDGEYVITSMLSSAATDKAMEFFIRFPKSVYQSNITVMSLAQREDESYAYDNIVYGRVEPRKWYLSSNEPESRSQQSRLQVSEVDTNGVLHVLASYSSEHGIQLYTNGHLDSAMPSKKDTLKLFPYEKGQAMVLFGKPFEADWFKANGHFMLLEARLYNRRLEDVDVELSYSTFMDCQKKLWNLPSRSMVK